MQKDSTKERPTIGTKRKTCRKASRLELWLEKNGFSSAQLEAACQMTHQQMGSIRAGRNVLLTTMIKIRIGASKLAGRVVAMDELFDLGDDSLALALALAV